MEAFFRNDQEVQEWIDLFIEKLFTVSLLSGTDADSEFYQGRQAIEKIVLSFQEMVELPEEAIMDGIRQLIEQRLPDSRVIENFPNFYQLMNEMILSGFTNPIAVPAMSTASRANFSPIPPKPYLSEESASPCPSSKVVLTGGWTPISSKPDVTIPFSLRQQLLSPLNAQDLDLNVPDLKELDLLIKNVDVQKTMDEGILESIVYTEPNPNALPILQTDIEFDHNTSPQAQEANNNNPKPNIGVEPSPPRRDPFRFNPSKAKSETVKIPPSQIPQNTSTLVKSTSYQPDNPRTDPKDVENASLKMSRAVRSAQIPINAEKLAQVLKQVFPNSLVRWNFVIGKNTFLAQIDKVLIYVQEKSQLQEVEYIQHLKIEMKKQGWNVYVCQQEDLSFSRRLERGLRLILH